MPNRAGCAVVGALGGGAAQACLHCSSFDFVGDGNCSSISRSDNFDARRIGFVNRLAISQHAHRFACLFRRLYYFGAVLSIWPLIIYNVFVQHAVWAVVAWFYQRSWPQLAFVAHSCRSNHTLDV